MSASTSHNASRHLEEVLREEGGKHAAEEGAKRQLEGPEGGTLLQSEQNATCKEQWLELAFSIQHMSSLVVENAN